MLNFIHLRVHSIHICCEIASVSRSFPPYRMLKWLREPLIPLSWPILRFAMPLIFPLHSLTNFHVRLHQASASNIANALNHDHRPYVLFLVPSYYQLSLLLPACLSQSLSSTAPPSTKTLPEHIRGPSEHLRPNGLHILPAPVLRTGIVRDFAYAATRAHYTDSNEQRRRTNP